MTMINFTQENLNKIHIDKFTKYLNKKGIEVIYHEKEYSQIFPTFDSHYIIIKRNSDFQFRVKVDRDNMLLWFVLSPMDQLFNELHKDISIWEHLVKQIYPEYEIGNLTMFHKLFSDMYQEINNEI